MAVLVGDVPEDSYRILPPISRPGEPLPDRSQRLGRTPASGARRRARRSAQPVPAGDHRLALRRYRVLPGRRAHRVAGRVEPGRGRYRRGRPLGRAAGRGCRRDDGTQPGLHPDRRGTRRDQSARQRALRAQRTPGARCLQGRHRRGAGAQSGARRRLYPRRASHRRERHGRLPGAQRDGDRPRQRLAVDRRTAERRRQRSSSSVATGRAPSPTSNACWTT